MRQLQHILQDWGTIGDGTSNWGYSPESTRCSLSVQVVYEDATTNPATTNANDIKSKTIFYYGEEVIEALVLFY